VPRGIEPRSPGFHSGAYIHSAKAPFVCDKYWLISVSSLSNSLISKHCGWRKIRTFNRRPNKPLLCHWAIHPMSRAEESNFFLPICSRVHTATSASTTNNSWPGEIRTHNPPVKSRIHLIQLSYEPICDDWQIWTINLYGISVMLLTIELSHRCSGYRIRTDI
jgi:hypothetical protein